MNVKFNLKKYRRMLSITTGLITGLLITFLLDTAGMEPERFISAFSSVSMSNQNIQVAFIGSIFLLCLSIVTAGIVTNFMLDEKERHCILGGFTGILMILTVTLWYFFFNLISFPTSTQLIHLIGPVGIPLVFLVYAIPISMIGFALGYFGSLIMERLYYPNVV